MTRIDLIIITVLKQNNATQKASAMSIKEIIEKTCSLYKYTTIYSNIKALCDEGYLLLGYKDANANTYYLSIEKALPLLEEDVIC